MLVKWCMVVAMMDAVFVWPRLDCLWDPSQILILHWTLHWPLSLCVNVRIIGEGRSPSLVDKWPFLALCWSLDISNKTRIQIKWAEIWCNYLNATLRHKTKEKFFIAALSAMRIGTRKFSSLCFLFAICVCHNYRKSLPWISIWTFNYNPWLDMKYLFLSF